jgi:adenine phosphoribosyltransferase
MTAVSVASCQLPVASYQCTERSAGGLELETGNSELEIGNWRLETFCMDSLKSKIRHVPDFPKAGILFYDITTLLRDPAGFRLAIDSVATPFQDKAISLVVGIESRGFILGAAVADRIGAGFVPVRKVGKLPSTRIRASYDLEYGTDSLEMHSDAIEKGQRVLIVDDLLATGGTAKATVDLVKQVGGVVEGVAFLIELVALSGRSKLHGETIHAVLKY